MRNNISDLSEEKMKEKHLSSQQIDVKWLNIFCVG